MAKVEFIKVSEAARRLDLTAETVRKYVNSRELPGIRVGVQLRVDWGQIEKRITETGRATASEPPPRRARRRKEN